MLAEVNEHPGLMWPWFARWTLHTKTLGRIAEIIFGESVWFFGGICVRSLVFGMFFFGIQLFWSFALIHHLQFSSCNTRSNIEIAFRLTSVIHYAWWRNTRVSSSSHRWHVCEMWISQGWNAHHEIGHHGKDETQGAMPQCLAMVSLQHVLKTWFGGTFLSLEMMFVCLISPNICLYCTKNCVFSCAMSILLSDFLYWRAIQIWPNLIDTARKDHRTMVDVEHTSQVSVMNSAAFNLSIPPSFSSHAGTSWGGTVANWEGRSLRVNGTVMAHEVIFNCQKCENYKTSPRNVWTWNLLGDWNVYYEEAAIQQGSMKSTLWSKEIKRSRV